MANAVCAKRRHVPSGVSSGNRKVGSATIGESPGGSIRMRRSSDHRSDANCAIVTAMPGRYSSAGPAGALARSPGFTLPGSNFPAAAIIASSAASADMVAPRRKRSGFSRATTKALR